MFSLFNAKKQSSEYIYLDHASATPVDATILETVLVIQKNNFANPGSIHRLGINSKKLIEEARKKIADALQARAEEIFFTSSGTESNNLALCGILQSFSSLSFKPQVLTTSIEHASVLEPLREMKNKGIIDLVELPVGDDGIITMKTIREALTPHTVLVSVIHANNEVGTVQPIREIGKMLEKHREAQCTEYPYFHSDACQSVNYCDIRPEPFRIDLCTLNSSKIYAPRGAGILYVNRRVKISPQIVGGDQEYGIRAGTENTAAIVACGTAMEIVLEMREAENVRLHELQTYALNELTKIPNMKIWGSLLKAGRLPNNINVSVYGIFSEEFVVGLDMKQIAISSKSACGMNSDEGSYVIRALGGTEQESKESIRISMGRSTTKENIDTLILEMTKIVERNEKAKKYLK